MRPRSISSKGTSAPPETSSASCHAASSTKAASESYRARLCMRRSFAPARAGPLARTWDCKHTRRTEELARGLGHAFVGGARVALDRPGRLAVRNAGEPAVRQALTEAFAPLRNSSGGYRVEDEYRYVIAQAATA